MLEEFKMILIDFSQFVLRNVFNNPYLFRKEGEKEINKTIRTLRLMVFSDILACKQRFAKRFGDVVISVDGINYWRKDVFPYYKWDRKKIRTKEYADIEWKIVFAVIDTLIDDLRNYFPYKVIRLERAESDDIIAVLTKKFSKEGQEVLIASSDKDFIQLQKYKGVFQVSPFRDRQYITEKNPIRYLQEKVLRGDSGDGVPNVLSDDSVFANGGRQTALRKNKIEEMIEHSPLYSTDETLKERFIRNRTMIDFDYIPEEIEQEILNEYNKPKDYKQGNLFNFLMSNGCGLLGDKIEKF